MIRDFLTCNFVANKRNNQTQGPKTKLISFKKYQKYSQKIFLRQLSTKRNEFHAKNFT